MTNKIYLNNPYLREIDARIVDKIYKDGNYYIKLDRTIFYPHLSGGQPGDRGYINGIKLMEVYEDNSDIIHVIKENIHSDRVILNIDWNHRLDIMQQHTGQHLLSSAFYKLYNGETVGFHIGSDYVYVDITLPSLSESDADKVETYVNRIIYSNFEIKSYYIEKNEMNKIPMRQRTTINSDIRIVEIDNIDFSPCAGTHLRNTGEIGIIKIRKWEKYKGNIRIEFVCGNRALYDYNWKNKAIKDISLMLSSKDIDIFNKVNILYKQKQSLEKENKYLKSEILKYESNKLINSSNIINGIPYIYKILDNKDLKDMVSLSNYIEESYNCIQIYGSSGEKNAQFLIRSSGSFDIDLNNILREVQQDFDIRSGGNKTLIQGSCCIIILEDMLNHCLSLIQKTIQQNNQ